MVATNRTLILSNNNLLIKKMKAVNGLCIDAHLRECPLFKLIDILNFRELGQPLCFVPFFGCEPKLKFVKVLILI